MGKKDVWTRKGAPRTPEEEARAKAYLQQGADWAKGNASGGPFLDDYQPTSTEGEGQYMSPSFSTTPLSMTPLNQGGTVADDVSTSEAPAIDNATTDALLDRPSDPYRPVNKRTGRTITHSGFDRELDAQDFAPGGYQPNESRSTSVGKYGGSPIFAATLAYPDSVVASAIGAINTKREQIGKAMKDLDPMAGVEDVNAPEYRDSFQRGAMGDLHKYQASVIDMWGEEEGLRRLRTPGTEEYQGQREKASHWTTISKLINQSTKSADAVIQGTRKGELQNNPILYKQAKELRHKLGERAGIENPEELANGMVVFNANVSLVDQLAKDKIMDVLKNAGSVSKIYERVKKGGDDDLYDPRFATLLGKKKSDRSAIVDALTDHYAPQYEGDLTRDEVYEMIDSMAPRLYEEDVKQTQIRAPKAGDKDGKPPASFTAASVVNVPSSSGDSGGEKARNEFRLTPYQTTGDKPHKVGKMNVVVNGKSKDLYAPSLVYDEKYGVFNMKGISLDNKEEERIKDVLKEYGHDDERVTEFIETNKLGKVESARILDNGDTMEMYFGGERDPYKILSGLLAQKDYGGIDPKRLANDWKNHEKRAIIMKKFQ